jgi:hypothetical protein
VTIVAPDKRWVECFAAIAGHTALSMNEDAPDVTMMNDNVYNRDGVYSANILEKSGNLDLAAACISGYFFKHPFSGRSYPEADNPGQVLWCTGQQWLMNRDWAWLDTVYPSVRKLASMIHYYRMSPRPLYIDMNSLEFGAAVPVERRREFVPGACDGSNFNDTEAFDLAGMRAAALLAEAAGKRDEAYALGKFADTLFTQYDSRYGSNLGSGYGSYSVLWPCRLYPLTSGKAYEQFRANGPPRRRAGAISPLPGRTRDCSRATAPRATRPSPTILPTLRCRGGTLSTRAGGARRPGGRK